MQQHFKQFWFLIHTFSKVDKWAVSSKIYHVHKNSNNIIYILYYVDDT